MESDITRRDVLRTAAKTTAGLGALVESRLSLDPERVFGANDRVRVAVCGLHGRGKDHSTGFRTYRMSKLRRFATWTKTC